MKDMTVDIIIRTKGRGIFLNRALDSVDSQTYRNYQVIIINDAGDVDEVENILNMQSSTLISKTKVIHNKINCGRWPSANKAIKQGKSEYIVLLDDDDTWEQTFLEETLKRIKQTKAHGALAASTKIIEECEDDNIFTVATEPYFSYICKPTLQELVEKNIIPTNSFLYSRRAYTEIGGYEDSMPVLADWLFNIRFLERFDIELVSASLARIHHRNSVKNLDYANTVVQGTNQHHETRAKLLNDMLRADLRNNALGLGYMMNSEDGIRRRNDRISEEIKSYSNLATNQINEMNQIITSLQTQIDHLNESRERSFKYRIRRKLKNIRQRIR